MKANPKFVLLGAVVLAIVSVALISLLLPAGDLIKEETDWIKANQECDIPRPSIFKDYLETFNVSYRLLGALSREHSVRGTRGVGKHTICVQRIVDHKELPLDALNAAYDRMAREVCKDARAFVKQYGTYRIYIQFALDASVQEGETRYIRESPIVSVTRECS